MVAEGWKAISIPTEVYEPLKDYYEGQREELRVKDGVRSLSAYISFVLREYLKEKKVI